MELTVTTYKTSSLFLLALLTLAGAACSDDTSPTAPEPAEPAPPQAAAAVKAPRMPYISDLQLHSIYLDMGGHGDGYDIVLTNPGPKAEGLYLEAAVTDNHYTADVGSTVIYCPVQDGTLVRGTCRMTAFVPPPPSNLALGPARLTIRLMQRGADGSITALDRRTFDVVLIHS
jgi:hypothetical protein